MTRENIFSVPVPAATATYTPVSNHQLLDVIGETLDQYNLTISSEKFQLANNGKQMLGWLHLNQPQDGLQMMLGLRNSYDKSRPIALAAGSSVFLCANGMVTGEIVHMRKHTGNVLRDLKTRVVQAVEELSPRFDQVVKDKQLLQTIEVDKTTTAQLLGELFHSQEVLRLQQLAIVQREIRFSEHFKMVEGGSPTLWNLYNNVTEALKTTHPFRNLEVHAKAHKFFVDCAHDNVLRNREEAGYEEIETTVDGLPLYV